MYKITNVTELFPQSDRWLNHFYYSILKELEFQYPACPTAQAFNPVLNVSVTSIYNPFSYPISLLYILSSYNTTFFQVTCLTISLHNIWVLVILFFHLLFSITLFLGNVGTSDPLPLSLVSLSKSAFVLTSYPIQHRHGVNILTVLSSYLNFSEKSQCWINLIELMLDQWTSTACEN